METKDKVRKEILSHRKALSEQETAKKSKRICDKLLMESWYPDCRKILAYSAVRNEVDLTDFIEQAWRDNKQIYFPKVSGETMEFFQVDNWQQLRKGTFGVMEPVYEDSPFCADTESVILVPGVAFSLRGERIGYGKGYYDRYLSMRNESDHIVIPIGIAFDFQIVDGWKADSNDVDMHRIMTDSREVVLE